MALGNRTPPYTKRTGFSIRYGTIASGVVDWLLIIATAIGGFFLGHITPNKRPFQLEDPNISYPHTINETVTPRDLVIATVGVPVVVIVAVSFIFVPGSTVPPHTPRSLIWRRKLWELYASLLSYALGMVSQQFIVNGLKNLCGKPRPDLLARCSPDIQHVASYIVGGIANITSNGQLVGADVCTSTDNTLLNDGFRSFPSGHSSSSAAGLGYLALFLAFKFSVVFPFASTPVSRRLSILSASAFPSRVFRQNDQEVYELNEIHPDPSDQHPHSSTSGKDDSKFNDHVNDYRRLNSISGRRSGAAPPLYLLIVVLVPFCGSIFIAASRWFDFRHHGFDILSGYLIGTTTGLVAFRFYQLPMSLGAGWAWGPRSSDKAFWAGIGSVSWAVPQQQWPLRVHDEEDSYEPAVQPRLFTSNSRLLQRPVASGSAPIS